MACLESDPQPLSSKTFTSGPNFLSLAFISLIIMHQVVHPVLNSIISVHFSNNDRSSRKFSNPN